MVAWQAWMGRADMYGDVGRCVGVEGQAPVWGSGQSPHPPLILATLAPQFLLSAGILSANIFLLLSANLIDQ